MPPAETIDAIAHAQELIAIGERVLIIAACIIFVIIFWYFMRSDKRRAERDAQDAKDHAALAERNLIVGEDVIILTSLGVLYGTGKLLGASRGEALVRTKTAVERFPISQVTRLKDYRSKESLN